MRAGVHFSAASRNEAEWRSDDHERQVSAVVESIGKFYPEASWQRCTFHFDRDVLKDVPSGKSKDVAAIPLPK